MENQTVETRPEVHNSTRNYRFPKSLNDKRGSHGWVYKHNTLYCDGVSVQMIQNQIKQKYLKQQHLTSPCFIYSEKKLKQNAEKYLKTMKELVS